jgi:transcriptional regulator with XRE-family HTH domain
MKIHEKIRSMRESSNWSQEEMADKLNMSVNGYSKIERGETNPHIPKLKQIAKEFNVDLLELMSENRNVYLISDNGNNHGCNVIGSSTEIAFEIQKLKSDLEHKNEIIELQKRDILRLEEMLELMKSVNLERT